MIFSKENIEPVDNVPVEDSEENTVYIKCSSDVIDDITPSVFRRILGVLDAYDFDQYLRDMTNPDGVTPDYINSKSKKLSELVEHMERINTKLLVADHSVCSFLIVSNDNLICFKEEYFDNTLSKIQAILQSINAMDSRSVEDIIEKVKTIHSIVSEMKAWFKTYVSINTPFKDVEIKNNLVVLPSSPTANLAKENYLDIVKRDLSTINKDIDLFSKMNYPSNRVVANSTFNVESIMNRHKIEIRSNYIDTRFSIESINTTVSKLKNLLEITKKRLELKLK